MSTLKCGCGVVVLRSDKPSLTWLLALALLFAAAAQIVVAQDQPSLAQATPAQDATAQRPGPPYTQQTPEQLQQLVAPIALYPDSLVAQILAASTFPEQVVEADRWIEAHPDLKGEPLADEVNQRSWDPSVKALTAFPSVLGNMDKNLSWTSSLGDAYYNQEQDVMDAVQVMRRKAQQAGNLKSTSQQTVTSDSDDIEIAPVDPEIVYVPAYDPWIVYGGPIVAWPGWYPYPGIWYDGPFLSFGVGFGIGYYGGFGWGWGHWGFDWHRHYAVYNHVRYYSDSRTFYNRDNFYRGGARGRDFDRGGGTRGSDFNRGGGERGGEANRGGAEHGNDANRGDRTRGGDLNRSGNVRGGDVNRRGGSPEPFGGNRDAARGYGDSRGQSGTRSNAFSGYGSGGEMRSYSSRGSASFGGGGFGSGGSHGGGSFGGGGHGGGGGRR
jgi:Protein of unknown function (DUF3300)